jgi:hypothetical protein
MSPKGEENIETEKRERKRERKHIQKPTSVPPTLIEITKRQRL